MLKFLPRLLKVLKTSTQALDKSEHIFFDGCLMMKAASLWMSFEQWQKTLSTDVRNEMQSVELGEVCKDKVFSIGESTICSPVRFVTDVLPCKIKSLQERFRIVSSSLE